jgi:glutamate carboxypeptidase
MGMSTMDGAERVGELLSLLRTREAQMVKLLSRFVRCESPSDTKPAVNTFGRMVAGEWRRLAGQAEYLPQRSAGDHLRVQWTSKAASKDRILVLGHLDTVYPLGTLRNMPFRVSRGRAFGPGVFDMKGGLVLALFAVEALTKIGWFPRRQVLFLWTSDEEIGSGSSRAIIEREAKRSAAVLVLEPASGLDGRLKTRRKGVGTAELVITGRSVHSGLDPENGVNAVHEMTLQLLRIMRFSQPSRGITVNATIAQGGTRSNVIPAAARATIDLRAGTVGDMREVERKLKALHPILHGASIKLRGGFSRPPLERSASARLFSHARRLAKAMGLSVKETFAGGGSDGNFTAALGVPTLDGLGAVGEGAHSQHENVILSALPERAALLAALLATI